MDTLVAFGLHCDRCMSLKRLLTWTRLERAARRFYGLLGREARPDPTREWQLRDARDNACIRTLFQRVLKRDSNCVDVGAHSGFFLRQFLEFAPAGRHWAIEPIPMLAAQLTREFPNVQVCKCALSDHEGQATFQYVPELPGWSGLRPQPYPVTTHPQSIPVELRRLDQLIPADTPIAFIKIDVEGAELEVLRGAAGILRQQKPLVLFECGKIHHTSYSTTAKDVHEWLASCGLGVFLLDQAGPLKVETFTEIYEASHRSGYDRTAHGNYLAMPVG
jgi:FkbM family methyltransferase